ncbi:MAG: FAD-dependent monooxygenase [Ottowia sp.]|uniref:FAD-dependent monooxygenase n=1 Tax=Ottowia sp. TaxID=1898956 RepID=UPI003C75538A
MQSFPIAIVGGGPVGLSMSLQLSLLGVRHVLFERNTEPTQHPKSRAINVRTMEIFREWGIHDEVRASGMQRPPLRFFGRDVMSPWDHVMDSIGQFGDLDDGRYSALTLLVKLCSQDALEPLLRERAAASTLADLRFGWQVTRWSETPGDEGSGDGEGGVVLHAMQDATGEQTAVRARFLVGADGGRSSVREQLGIGCEGPAGLQEAVSVLFRSNVLAQRLGTHSAFVNINNPDTIGAAVIAPVDDSGRAALLGRPKVMDEMPFDEIDWMRQLVLAVGDPQEKFELLDVRTWQVTVRIATRYRQGRVFLAGDAAHLMPPNGGFNMNTGIQDVHNLCWKLAGVLKGWAAPALLDSYTAERRPVAEFNAGEAVLNFRSHNARDEQGKAVHYRPEHFIHPGLSLGFRYNAGALWPEPGQDPQARWVAGTYEPDAIPGARAPHAWLQRGGERISTSHLFGGRFAVLAAPGCEAAAAVTSEGLRRGIPVEAFSIGGSAELQPADGRWEALYGVGGDGLVIVRPDGHVGARWRRAPDEAEQAQAWDRLSGRSVGAVPVLSCAAAS